MKKKNTTKDSGTDFERLGRMSDKDIDTTDIPEVTPEQFARAIVRRGLKPIETKTQITLRVDSEVLEWFRQQGPGYQTRINALLRAYMDANTKGVA